jgi:hypothetical protein
MASKIKTLILDLTFFSIFAYVILYVLEFMKPGVVSNYIDLNRLSIYLLIIIISVSIASQIKKIR